MSTTYTKQLSDAKRLLEGIKRFRGDCPSCGGKNTYSVVDVNGTIMWNCFSAACGTKGVTEEIRLATVEEMFSGQKQITHKPPRTFTPPPYFKAIMENKACITYLKVVNAWDAYYNDWATVRYDPKLNRVVFSGGPTAVGRSLDAGSNVKWYRYNKSDRPYCVWHKGKPSTSCVIVEDAASACNVAHFADGIALLGTSLTDGIKLYLQSGKWLSTTICLDPDASDKAIKMCKELSAIITGVKVIFLEKDPKCYEWGELKERIYGRYSGTKTA